MTEQFNLNMQPILEWMNGHSDRDFRIQFQDELPVVVMIFQDKTWRLERRVSFVCMTDSKVSQLNLAVEKMLRDWARYTGKTTDTEPPVGVSVGDYVLATRHWDGNPNDQWCIGLVSEHWPDKKRWLVVDSDGKSFRPNGFQCVKKITAEVGNRILEIMKAGANPPSMWLLLDVVQAGIDNTTNTEGGA